MHKVIYLPRCKYGFQKLSTALISSHLQNKAWITLNGVRKNTFKYYDENRTFYPDKILFLYITESATYVSFIHS